MTEQAHQDQNPQPAEDNSISVGNIEVGGDVGGNIHIGHRFTKNVKIVFQGGWRIFAGVFAVVAVLLGAILWFVIPKKDAAMTAQFNVAVAEFITQNADGKKVSGEDGKLLAGYVSQEIQTQFSAMELEKSIAYQVWGPDETGIVTGSTPEERASSAEALAKKINAYILIYGVITIDGENSKFQPEFYINHKSFQDASEITGSFELGRQLLLSLPFQGIQSAENPALAGRVRALNLITMGLAYYSMDKFDDALDYFQQAEAEQDWVGAGREVIYLLLGNAYIRKDSQAQDFSDLPRAEENYALALEDNPNYGRALIGQVNVLYLTAAQDQDACDMAKLAEADALLATATALEGQPESANIETKVHYYTGQMALVRYRCGQGADWLLAAQAEFLWITGQYEALLQASGERDLLEAESIQTWASYSYARLGYIATRPGHTDVDLAVEWFRKAVEIASPYYKGAYNAMIGDIYAAAGKKEEAAQAYNAAIMIAERNADAASLETYEAKLKALK